MKRNDVVSVKTEISPPQLLDGAEQQSDACQQDHRQRLLNDHQAALRALMPCRGSARSFLERGLKIKSRTLERGRKTKQNPHSYRNAEGEKQHRNVHADVLAARQT